jgi:hypothetical protein
VHLPNKSTLPPNLFEGDKRGPARSRSSSLITSGGACRIRTIIHMMRHGVIQQGHVPIWIGDETGDTGGDDIAITRPNTPHKFKNLERGRPSSCASMPTQSSGSGSSSTLAELWSITSDPDQSTFRGQCKDCIPESRYDNARRRYCRARA